MKSRKMLALLLAMVMVLGLCSMASAAASTDRVQINNMMVDASLVETQDVETIEPQMVSLEAAVAATAYNPGDNPSYAPINAIAVDWSGYDLSVGGIMQGRVVYALKMPGATASDLNNRTLSFTISNRTAMSDSDIVTITMGSQQCTARKNSTTTMVVDLSIGTQLFTVTWTENGTSRTATCMLNVSTPSAASVVLTSLTVAGTPATLKDPEDTTVGGVTRYIYTAELPVGTATTALDTATVVVVPQNSSATMTLKNSDGTVAATGSKADGTYTFSNVNFNAGTKTLTVTCGDLTRDYQVSASISGRKVNVYIAIRTYTVLDWLDGTSTTSTNYYDYVANGYGSGADISDTTERTRIATIATALQCYNTRTNTLNTPISTSSNDRRIFAADSYCKLRVDAGSSVMSALKQFLAQEGLYETGSNNNYISYMGNGSASSAQIGEFDCGSASGWMYTARTARDDLSTPLPNAGAANWTVSNNMYIDWYYTAAYGADFGYSMFDLG